MLADWINDFDNYAIIDNKFVSRRAGVKMRIEHLAVLIELI